MHYSALLLIALSFGSPALGLRCDDDLVRGVTLGGLFLLEPWITPSIFEEANAANGGGELIVDEYTYAQYVDPAVAAERLER